MLPAARPRGRPSPPRPPRSARPPRPGPKPPLQPGEKGGAKPPLPPPTPAAPTGRHLGRGDPGGRSGPPPTPADGLRDSGDRSGAVPCPGPPLAPLRTHLESISSADPRGTHHPPHPHLSSGLQRLLQRGVVVAPPTPNPQPCPLGGPGMGDRERSADIHALSWGASARGDNFQAGQRVAWQPAALTGMDLAGGGTPAPPGGVWLGGTRCPPLQG